MGDERIAQFANDGLQDAVRSFLKEALASSFQFDPEIDLQRLNEHSGGQLVPALGAAVQMLLARIRYLDPDQEIVGVQHTHGFKIRYTASDHKLTLNSIDLMGIDDGSVIGLPQEFAHQLSERLRSHGVSAPDADRIGHATAEFAEAADFDTPEQQEAAVAIAVAAVMADRASRSPRDAPLWVDRDPKRFPTAESFLRHHYGFRLGIEGDLTLSEVGRYDTPLLTALNREFKSRRHELHLLLPTARERADQRLLKKYGYIPQGRDRQSKLTMMRLERKPAR